MKIQRYIALVVLSLATVPGARAAVREVKLRTLTLLTLACLLAAVPATAQVNYGVSGNTAYVASSPGASGDVVIASTFNGYPVTSIRDYAFLHRTGLTRVTIPASVTSIGAGAFLNCTNLTNVTFLGNPPVLYPDLEVGGVTQFVNIGAGAKAYYNCGTTGWGATYGGLPTVMLCPSQINYAVSGDTAYVTRSPNASGDVVIASTYLGYPVTSIGVWAFSGCSSLASLTIPNSVTNIGLYAFDGCTSLTNLSVDAANPVYSSLNGVLFNKAQTTLITFPPSRGSYVIPDGVANIERSAFFGCMSLTNVTIGNSVTGMGEAAFVSCSNLTSVIIGNSVTNIGFYAFAHCISLTRLTFPTNVLNIGSSAFYNCRSLTNFTFLGNAPQLLFDLNAGFAQFQNVGAGAKAYYHCGTTGWGATYGSLPTVMLCPSQVNYAVFGETAYVTSSPNASGDIVIASTYNGYPVTIIGGYAFSGTNVTSVTIPSSVNLIGSLAFTNCTSLARVTIPNSVTNIGAYAFTRCTSLTNMTIPNSVTRIGYRAFRECWNLRSVNIPHGVTSIDPEQFQICTNLTNISVAAANPAYSSLDGVVFNKAQTTLIVFPNGRDGGYVMPDSVTSIGSLAFSYGTRQTNVTIGRSVTNIGDWAFFHCSSLTKFTFLGNAPAYGGATFFNVGAGAKVYYSCGTTGWGATYGGLPTVMLCPPQIGPGSAGVKPGGFGFTLARLTNQTVVEASTDLLNWQPIWTNTLPGTSAEFLDPQALPNRFYRARSN